MKMKKQLFETHKVIRLQYWSQAALLRLKNKDKVLSGVGYLSFCSCNSPVKLSGDVSLSNQNVQARFEPYYLIVEQRWKREFTVLDKVIGS